jgi:TolA-binding protein
MHRILAAIFLLALVVTLVQAQGVNNLQLNWRIGEAERRAGALEGAVNQLAGQLNALNSRHQQLEQRFNKLVGLLDDMQRKQEQERERLRTEHEAEKQAGQPPVPPKTVKP